MRPLAVSGYTATQLEAALRAKTGADSPRFELLDNAGNKLGSLTTVTKASIGMSVERNIVRQLALEMLPDERLRGQLFRSKVRAYYRLRMPDNGIAEWNAGTFIWSVPERQIASGDETWKVTLGDSGWLLDAGGVGTQGFEGADGERISDAMVRALIRSGQSDTSGVVPDDETLDEPKTWAIATPRAHRPLVRAHGSAAWVPDTEYRATKWADVLSDLADANGYYPCWFDADDLARLLPAPDLAKADPVHTFDTRQDGLLIPPVDTGHRLDGIANRVFLQARNQKGIYNTEVADANIEAPGHPYSEAVTGQFIDAVVDDSTSPSRRAMRRRALKHLHERLSTYQTVKFKCMVWPVLEPYDVIGLAFTGDAEFNTPQRFHLRDFTWDLFASTMDLDMRRLWTVV